MILAAGLGTRLQPITKSKPKALVEVRGKPLLDYVMRQLRRYGVTDVIINVHHFPGQIIDYVHKHNNFGIRVSFSHEEELLDTGGGLKKASYFFDDGQPFFLHNVDIISDINLRKMFQYHTKSTALATLAVNHRETSRYFLFDDQNLLCGWKSVEDNRTVLTRTPQSEPRQLGFCGIHVISPDIFPKLTETGNFSIVQSYLRLAREGEKIAAYLVDSYHWRDVGKLSELS